MNLDFIKKIIKNAISFALTQEFGNTINSSVYKFKNKHKRIYRLLYGKASDENIFDNIIKKLDGNFDILMIHCSLNNMMPMYTGNINKLMSLLLSYCQKNNITLAMPAFFNGSNFQAGKFYEDKKNIFDVRNTISGMGLLSEIFRRTKDVKRSIHPTHSICALGPLADTLTKNHNLTSTTYGEGSPFYEMTKHRTMILGIGAKTYSLTQTHSAEEIMEDKFPIPLFSDHLPVTCLDESGNRVIFNLKIKNPEYMIDEKSFYRIIKKMKITEWTFKGIPFFLTRANIVTETVIEEARNGRTIYKKK